MTAIPESDPPDGARSGALLLAVATMAAGVFDLIWGEFEAAHQPIQAWGDRLAAQPILAYFAALWLILAGAALLSRRTVRPGALAAAGIYLVFGLFWLPRFYTVPHILGFRVTLLLGMLAGMFTQLIVVAGALTLYASTSPSSTFWKQTFPVVARWTFGIGALLFSMAHLTGVQQVSQMMPPWMPLGGPFWVVLTGIAFALAGLAILSGILDVLAAYLLGLMLVIFELALVPLVIANPRQHIPWGSNAYSLAAAGAVLIFAASIARRRSSSV